MHFYPGPSARTVISLDDTLNNTHAVGVASRAAMLQGVNAAQQQYYQQQQQQYSLQPQRSLAPAPHWQQQCAPVKPMWYNGGPMPDK